MYFLFQYQYFFTFSIHYLFKLLNKYERNVLKLIFSFLVENNCSFSTTLARNKGSSKLVQ